MDNQPTPIKDPHVAFARAVVALAREHGADHLQVQFSMTGSKLWREGWSGTNVTMSWSEGRHGERSRFGLRAEASISVEEQQA